MARLSIVDWVYNNEVGSGSVMQVGDSVNMILKTGVFAVQREVPIFYGNEGSFAAYPLFERPFPQPEPDGPASVCTDNLGSCIKVRSVRILAISSSAVLHIGSNHNIRSETRIKNIRQFVQNKPGPPGKTTFVKIGDDSVAT